MGAPTIVTGLDVTVPASFVRGRNGDVYFFNGKHRGYRWDGVTAAAEAIGITAPTSKPTIALATGAGTKGDLSGVTLTNHTVNEHTGAAGTATLPAGASSAWVVVKNSGTNVLTVAAAGADTIFDGTAGQVSTTLSVGNNIEFVWDGTQWILDVGLDYMFAVQYIDDTSPDPIPSSISDLVTVPAIDGLGFHWSSIPVSPEARVVNKRLWRTTGGEAETLYLVTTITNATTSYNSDTQTDAQISASTNTALPILQPNGALNARRYGVPPSNKPFAAMFQDRLWLAGRATLDSSTPRNEIAFSEDDEPESMPAVNVLTIQDNTGDEDEVTGLMPYGAFLYILKERHIYSLKFIRQPLIDVAINCIAWRGCLNNRTWDILDGVAYVMDQSGIYKFQGGAPVPIDAAIQNQFWDGTIDFSVSKWFWVKADTARKLVYFAVSYTADSSTRPKRCLVYNTLTGAWMPDKYLWELGGAVVVPIGGQARFLIGGEHERVLVAGSGTSDIVTAARTTGTFDSSVTDAPVAIVSGTGAGQITLAGSPSWPTTPDSTSVYVTGAIEASFKTGQMEFPQSEKRYRREIYLATTPTAHQNFINLKQFKNKYQTATTQAVNEDRGVGVTATAGQSPIVFDIQQSRVPFDNTSSVQRVAIDGIVDLRSNAQRWIAIELSCYQGLDQISIDSLEIVGVQV